MTAFTDHLVAEGIPPDGAIQAWSGQAWPA
jgi:hypothetical protein